MKNISIWLSQIEDNNLHHIGEYYTYLTGRNWKKESGDGTDFTVGFKRWLMDKKSITKEDIAQIESGFWILRDMYPSSFLIRRKI